MAAEDASIAVFDPATNLHFQRKGEEALMAPLKISNAGDAALLFRIQTTSPANYRVRPNHGVVAVGQSADIQLVMINAPTDSKKHDKFQIKYGRFAGENMPADFSEAWTTLEGKLHEHRLRCTIEGSESHEPEETNGADSVKSALAGRTASPVPQVASDVSLLNPEALRRELREARIKIQQLAQRNQELIARNSAESSGLRQRNGSEAHKNNEEYSDGTTVAGIPHEWAKLLQSQYGFPPVFVVLVALLAFLIGLLF